MDSSGTNHQSAANFHGEFADRRQSPCAGMRVITECYLVLRTGNSRGINRDILAHGFPPLVNRPLTNLSPDRYSVSLGS